MRFTEVEPGLLGSFVGWLIDSIYDWYYKHWGCKRWTFGQKWNAMIERENLIAMMKSKGYTFNQLG
jgi:hypothetical protein